MLAIVCFSIPAKSSKITVDSEVIVLEDCDQYKKTSNDDMRLRQQIISTTAAQQRQ